MKVGKRTAYGPAWLASEILLWGATLYYGFDMREVLHDVLPAAVGLGVLSAPITIFLSDIRDLLATANAQRGRKP